MAWNVIASWAGHMVFVISGFIMPRIIDHSLGQVSLGVWDFSWSIVNYFGLAGLGVGSSVNRHVAMYRMRNEPAKVKEAVSSVMAIQAGISAFIFMLVGAAIYFVPRLFAHRLGTHATEAVWVVGLLGCSLAVQMAFDSFRGVITGCHRWDLHNAINAAAYGITVVGMIIVLERGKGLRSASAIYLLATIVTEIARAMVAKRVCPEISYGFAHASREHAKKMFLFGAKRIAAGLPPLILNQSCSLLITGMLGPAMLAVYSRPAGLMRSLQTFIDKFAFVTTPTAASLQQKGDLEDVRQFLIRSTELAVAIVTPLALLFIIQGPAILGFWMGKNYANGALVLTTMAIGLFLPMTQQPALNILIGLNKHGKLGLFTVGTAVAGLLLGIGAVQFVGLSLLGAALIASVPLALANGVVLPWFACHELDLKASRYFFGAFVKPMAWCIPYVAVLVGVRMFFADRYLMVLGASAILGGIALLPGAWVLAPESMRRRLRGNRALAQNA